MRQIIVTVDTEGDNLWKWKPGAEITTENVAYIPRFQELCEEYGLKPVYLTNYEMAMDSRWIEYGGKKARESKCEIGMHLHAWNTPPEYVLKNRFGGNPYITEYPAEVMDAKVKTMINLLQNQFDVPIVSHRSGRWATNETYFSMLVKHGIRVDCSVVPQINLSGIPGHSKNCGNDYRKARTGVYEIFPGLLEVPMTTRRIHHGRYGTLKHKIRSLVLGDSVWLRPINKSVDLLKMLTEQAEREKEEYIEFMIHSSELMPGGSVYCKSPEEVERLYKVLEDYFCYVTKRGYIGSTLQKFVRGYGDAYGDN